MEKGEPTFTDIFKSFKESIVKFQKLNESLNINVNIPSSQSPSCENYGTSSSAKISSFSKNTPTKKFRQISSGRGSLLGSNGSPLEVIKEVEGEEIEDEKAQADTRLDKPHRILEALDPIESENEDHLYDEDDDQLKIISDDDFLDEERDEKEVYDNGAVPIDQMPILEKPEISISKKRKMTEDSYFDNSQPNKIAKFQRTGFMPCGSCFLCFEQPDASKEIVVELGDQITSEKGEFISFRIEKEISCYNPVIYVLKCLSENCGAQSVEMNYTQVRARNFNQNRLYTQLTKTKNYFSNFTQTDDSVEGRFSSWKEIPSEIRHLVKHYKSHHPQKLSKNTTLKQLFSVKFIDQVVMANKSKASTSKGSSKILHQNLRDKIVLWTNRLQPSIISDTYISYSYYFQKNCDQSVVQAQGRHSTHLIPLLPT